MSKPIYLLWEATNYQGGYNERPNYEIIGYVKTGEYFVAECWLNDVPDNFTKRKIEKVEHL